VLSADADGVASAVYAEAGQVLIVGAPIARLARNGDREAAVALPETLLDLARSASAHAVSGPFPAPR
jgi:pyruvate/2-oxoglutarate dehydrogenase complex dihydrolipoamide acyltransferase (E2) component